MNFYFYYRSRLSLQEAIMHVQDDSDDFSPASSDDRSSSDDEDPTGPYKVKSNRLLPLTSTPTKSYTHANDSKAASNSDEINVIPPTPKTKLRRSPRKQLTPSKFVNSIPIDQDSWQNAWEGSPGKKMKASHVSDCVGIDNTGYFENFALPTINPPGSLPNKIATNVSDPQPDAEYSMAVELDEDPNTAVGCESENIIDDETPEGAFDANSIPMSPTGPLSDVEMDSDTNTFDIEHSIHENSSSEYTSTPSSNFQHDIEYKADKDMKWQRLVMDTGPCIEHPFTGQPGASSGLYLANPDCTSPGDFFNELFDDSMWSKICYYTNEHVKSRDVIDTLGKNKRMNRWYNVEVEEMKVFFAHLLVMGLVSKACLEDFWSKNQYMHTPFFGQVMSRNRFQNILWNIHFYDPHTSNPPEGDPNHDKLFKVRPFLNMVQTNFKNKYKPGKEISLDESTCPFKGRVKFLCYSPRKPNRFHLKLYMVSEAESGYICGFEVYTGKAHEEKQKQSSRTGKTARGRGRGRVRVRGGSLWYSR